MYFFFLLNLVYVYIFRDNGVKVIENLMIKRGRFDYVFLEIIGLVDFGMDYILIRFILCLCFIFFFYSFI